MALTPTPLPPLSRFSCVVAIGVLVLPRSKDVLGVLGVFVVDPNDAKAPDPSPKADDAPVVGDETFVVVKGARPFNALILPPALPSLPSRLVVEYVRDVSFLICSLVLLLEVAVEVEILLEL